MNKNYLFAGLIGLMSTSARAEPIKLNACWFIAKGRPSITFTLTNNTGGPLRFGSEYLPWNSQGAIYFLYERVNTSNNDIRKVYNIEDENFREIELANGKSIVGSISLDSHFLDIENKNSLDRLVFVWNYSNDFFLGKRYDFGGSAYFYKETDKCKPNR